MVQTLDEAQRERELSKEALERNVTRFEDRIRAQLDWKSRLRNDGLRIGLVVGGALTLGMAAFLWQRSRKPGTNMETPEIRDMDDVAAELTEIRKQLRALRKGQTTGPAKIVTKIASAAAAAAGTYAARQMMQRPPEEHQPDSYPSR